MYVLLEVINTNCIKTKCVMRVVHLFSERLVNVWNSLPGNTDFSTLPRFRRSILRVSFTKFLKSFCVIMFYVFLILCVTVEITLLYL